MEISIDSVSVEILKIQTHLHLILFSFLLPKYRPQGWPLLYLVVTINEKDIKFQKV